MNVITSRAHGIDVSKYDLFFRPVEAVNQLDFGVQRVGYGLKRDEAFDTLWLGMIQMAIRGGYHYLNSGLSWRSQADKFIEYVGNLPYHFFVSDFEQAFNTLSVDFAYQAWQWINYVEQTTGKPVLLYTSPSLYNEYIYPSQSKYGIDWNKIDLWTAQWFYEPNPDGTPINPIGRTTPWKLWQYTDKAMGTQYGVSRDGACDLNVYNGSVAQMRAWLDLETIEPPNNGGSMHYGKIKVFTNIRNSPPGGSYVDIGDLNAGDTVTADEVRQVNGYPWWHLKSWSRNGVALMLPAAECWAYGMNIEELAPPVATLPDLPVTIMLGDDMTYVKQTVNVTLKAKA
jgi:GH25 family lysozyme M1 (1,4-beta-N-acetylmuramidase)